MSDIKNIDNSNSDMKMKIKSPVKSRCGLVLKVAAVVTGCLAGAQLTYASISSTTYDHSQYIDSGIVTKINPNDKRIQYTYDAVNNLTNMALPDAAGGAINYGYTYDLTDQLKTITYPEGSQTFGYDDFDRLESISVSEFDLGGSLLEFSYDHQDRLTKIVYPGNGEACYEYDPDGRITRVGRSPEATIAQCSGATEKTDYSYDGKGRLVGISYPNGLNQFRSYYTDTGLVKEVGYEYANGTRLYSDSYEYIPFTRLYHKVTRHSVTESKVTEYGYDAYERVTLVLEPDGRQTVFTYDPFGNRFKEIITNVNDANATGGSPKAYGEYQYIYPDKSNRLAQIDYKAPGETVFAVYETLSYDVAGHMTTRINSSGTTSYVFDDRGLMIAATTADGTSITYSYDALGNRRAKTVNGVTTNYLTAPIFGMSHVLAELAPDMSIKATYVYAGPQLLKEEPSATDRSLDLYMLHEGKVGSITHTVDMNGSVRNEYDYDTFGTRSHVKTAGTGSNQHFGYTGEMLDAESGLLYLRARYYDPSIGRFISADPYLGRMAEPVTQNRYIYVHNNPLLFVDPLGNEASPANFGFVAGRRVLVGVGIDELFSFSVDLNFGSREYMATGQTNVTEGFVLGVSVAGFQAAVGSQRSAEDKYPELTPHQSLHLSGEYMQSASGLSSSWFGQSNGGDIISTKGIVFGGGMIASANYNEFAYRVLNDDLPRPTSSSSGCLNF